MGADEDQMARIQARLYALVSANPGGPDADQARSILARLPHHAAGEALPGMRPQSRDPNPSGPEFTPLDYGQANGRESPAARAPHVPFTDVKLPVRQQAPQDVLHPSPRRPDTELEADPLLQEGVGQAMTMPALHGAGVLLSGLGRQFLKTEAGQAMKFLAERGAPTAAPKATEFLAPSPEFDPMGDLAKAREALELRLPHTALDLGAPGAAGYALWQMGHHGLAAVPAALNVVGRNAAPLAARAAMPMIRAGEAVSGAAPTLSLGGNPLFNAVEGR